MTTTDEPYYDDDDDDVCWHCGGECGWSSCMEDCCPVEGGEECCDFPGCWTHCPECKGKGYL